MAAFFLLTFSMESYLLRFKRQWLGWLKSAPAAYPQRTPSIPPGSDIMHTALREPTELTTGACDVSTRNPILVCDHTLRN